MAKIDVDLERGCWIRRRGKDNKKDKKGKKEKEPGMLRRLLGLTTPPPIDFDNQPWMFDPAYAYMSGSEIWANEAIDKNYREHQRGGVWDDAPPDDDFEKQQWEPQANPNFNGGGGLLGSSATMRTVPLNNQPTHNFGDQPNAPPFSGPPQSKTSFKKPSHPGSDSQFPPWMPPPGAFDNEKTTRSAMGTRASTSNRFATSDARDGTQTFGRNLPKPDPTKVNPRPGRHDPMGEAKHHNQPGGQTQKGVHIRGYEPGVSGGNGSSTASWGSE
ncbi:hypothetical protein K505DRAFT_334759 [Melanomma pulvis-pyrius CBS 109.77]|uniref:Uncharacterized protein n=1 Tax=Melanomma pulvis-pyrius CBS 109.77 TaxID=1314802 RepID=A0A6A6XKF6_9PLEO|nr:hypothetical protein K505DRAFT_334759 [Melanomma pulvis-pyrius CBS 109.77]